MQNLTWSAWENRYAQATATHLHAATADETKVALCGATAAPGRIGKIIENGRLPCSRCVKKAAAAGRDIPAEPDAPRAHNFRKGPKKPRKAPKPKPKKDPKPADDDDMTLDLPMLGPIVPKRRRPKIAKCAFPKKVGLRIWKHSYDSTVPTVHAYFGDLSKICPEVNKLDRQSGAWELRCGKYGERRELLRGSRGSRRLPGPLPCRIHDRRTRPRPRVGQYPMDAQPRRRWRIMTPTLQEMNATEKARQIIESAGFSVEQIRDELGLDAETQVARHHADVGIGILTDDGSSVRRRSAIRAAGFSERREPRWGDVDIPARLENIYLEDGDRVPGRKAIVREDTRDVLNVVSDRYMLVQHKEPMEIMHEAIDALGLDVRGTKTTVGMRGGYAKVEWLLDKAIEIAPAKGDVLVVSAFVRTSYDYTSAFEVGLSLLRLVCGNGMTIPETIAGMKRRHVGSFSVAEAIQQVSADLKELPEIQRILVGLTGQRVVRTRFEKWLRKQVHLSAGAATEILDRYDRTGGSAWDAYNAITWYASHQVKGRMGKDRMVLRADKIRASANRMLSAPGMLRAA